MNVPKSQISNFRHRKSTLNCMETGFQCPQSTLLVGLITVLSHLKIAQIRISCSGWTHQICAERHKSNNYNHDQSNDGGEPRIHVSNLTSVLLILEKRKFAKYEFRNVKMWLLRPNFAELEL